MSDDLLGTIMTASVTSAIYEVVLTLTTCLLYTSPSPRDA